MNEKDQEKVIQLAGCNAPRLTPEDIDKVIENITYSMLPSGKCMVCEIVLVNGFSVRGESAVVSPENFRQELGRQYSYEKARDKIWELEGYLLQQRLYESAK